MAKRTSRGKSAGATPPRRRASRAARQPDRPSRRLVSLVTLVIAVSATLLGSCFRRQEPTPPPSAVPPPVAGGTSSPTPSRTPAPPPGPRFNLPSVPALPGSSDSVAAVGTFNIEWFSLTGRNARQDSDLQNIASVIKQTGCAVLGLQEVGDAEALEALVKYLPGWKFQVGTSGRQQRCGILWDSARANVGRAAEWPDVNEGIEKGRGSLRAPLVAPVKIGDFDFTLVVVHLKALFEEEDMRMRRAQVKKLRARVEEYVAAKGEKDVILVGDFNDFADSDAIKELTDDRRGKLRFVVTGARLPKSVSSYLGRSGRIDHIIVTSPAVSQEEWTGDAYVYPKPKSKDRQVYESSVSDHLPSWATFKTDKDSDP